MKHVRRPAHARRTPTSHALPEAPRRTPARMAVAGAAALGLTVASTLVLLPMADAGTDVSGRVIVAYEDGQAKGVVRAIEAVGGHIKRMHSDIDVAVAELPAGVSRALAKSPGVKYIEKDEQASAVVAPNDPYYPSTGPIPSGQWSLRRAKVDQAWTATGFGSRSAVIAVLDSGVSAKHPDLVGNVITGRNVLTGTADVTDTDGHGTAVAGIAAASANNGIGVAGACGTCSLMPVKVTSGNFAYDSDMAAGLTWAVDNGARIVNISYAGTYSSATMAAAVSYARSKGVVIIAGAGNTADATVNYPAAYPGVVSVAATSSTPGDPLQPYSTFGSWVDIAAPAGAPTTTAPDTYSTFGGTSSAAPLVAGVAGLLLTVRPDLSGPALESALLVGADPVSGVTGFGRIDALDAVNGVLGSLATPSPTPTSTASSAPAPTASSSATATAGPTASPSPTPTAPSGTTATTATFSGSLNAKKTKATYTVAASAAGALSTALSFACSNLTMAFTDGAGTALGSAGGGSVLRNTVAVPAGKVMITVSGSSKCSFTLAVTAP